MSQPTILCPYCTDGVTDDGRQCGWCNGQSHRVWPCDLCGENASEVTEMGEFLCLTCMNTLKRNDEAA